MKTKKTKLSVNKTTIANLGNKELDRAKGGTGGGGGTTTDLTVLAICNTNHYRCTDPLATCGCQ